jgi:hypothetical protein
MHHYRHVLSRMRLGETDRAVARAGLMGRPQDQPISAPGQQDTVGSILKLPLPE